MSKDKSKPNITFGVKDFEVVSYQSEKPKRRFKVNESGFKVTVEPKISIKFETVSIAVLVEIVNDKKIEEIVGKIKTKTTFKVTGLETMVNEHNSIKLPEALAVTLLSISFSTTRGALAVKASGDALSGIVLPLIEPHKMYAGSALNGEISIDKK